ncbi:hypothetical protein ACEPAI_5346 [Sanghuangporus weigelae]
MQRLVFNIARSQSKLNVGRCTAWHGVHISSRRLLSTSRKPPKDSSSPRHTDNNNGGGSDPTNSPPPDLDALGIPPTNFSKPTLTALNFWYRFAKFSFIGLAVLAGGTFAALEGTHLWVEYFGIASPSDSDGELMRWGWIKEAERWTGGANGGTDPALGTKARYALRSAWMTQNWGTGAQIISDNALAQAQQSPNKAIEARLEFSHDFLSLALSLAEEKERAGKPLRPETISEILVRKAATLERIGSKGALYDARATYERVWDAQVKLDADAEERARLALKLGDVNARLGDSEEARSWWSQALQLASSPSDSAFQRPSDMITTLDNTSLPKLPERLPDSPHAQRTIAATLSSLSALLAQSGQLTDAKAIQEKGIRLILPVLIASEEGLKSSSPSSLSQESSESASEETSKLFEANTGKSAPQWLHSLFLQHRLSLLTLHRAEVNHALKSSSSGQTLKDLVRAAIEAEEVIFRLTASSPSALTSLESSSETPVHKAQLDENYSRYRTLEGPANSLLRDARRTALHAWTLSGILHENASSSTSSSSHFSTSSTTPLETSASLWGKLFSSSVPPSSPSVHQQQEAERRDNERWAALRCYARALAWAGADDKVSYEAYEKGEEPEPSREMLPSEWKTLWEGYVRTRAALLASVDSAIAQQEKEDAKDEKQP